MVALVGVASAAGRKPNGLVCHLGVDESCSLNLLYSNLDKHCLLCWAATPWLGRINDEASLLR